jgi:RNA polymerase sigma-70 factor, ECF subfamily
MNPAAASTVEQEVAAAYEAYADGLYRYAVSLLRQTEDARDALQEAFLRYFLQRNCGGQVDLPRAWLYRVLRNYLIDQLDTASRKHEIPGSNTDRFQSNGDDPETLMYQSQVADQIRTMLSDRELNCLLLRTEGLSYAEIAEVMTLKVGTVGAYLAHVQKKLQDAATGDHQYRIGATHALAMLCYESAC